MRVIRAIVAAFSCFSAIPMPQIPWDEDCMRYMMAAFPLVGAVIGALCWLWAQLCGTWALGPFAQGVGLALIPVMVSGGIHLDGLADVVDAQSSHASPERKREILKDPHVGAFAIIGTCSYLMAYAALASELDLRQAAALACTPVISRCLSGIATVTLHASKTEGMFAAERSSANARVVRAVLLAILFVASALMAQTTLPGAALSLVASLASLAYVTRLAETQFGGMSGDLAGYFLQMCELAMLACLVFSGRMW